jgi:hypothetical protein
MYKTIILILTTALIMAACSTPITEAQGIEIEPKSEVIETAIDPTLVEGTQSEEPMITEEPVISEEAEAMFTTNDLNSSEENGLLYMREEEKLARDVYLKMYELWNIPIFKNIANSESAHMEVILSQLIKSGLDDPAKDKANGEFSNPDLQALYDELVAQGSQSLEEALKVGAAIEEIDILDLEEHIAQTNDPDILMAYDNLLDGSANHLRSFVRLFEQRAGQVYIPQHLTQEEYAAIISAEMTMGNKGYGGGNGNNRNNGYGNK